MKAGWKVRKLGGCIKLEYGKGLSDELRKPDGKYPVYGANGVKSRSDAYLYDKRSIIVGRKGSVGEVNLTECKFWPLDVAYYVTFNENDFDLKFIYYLLLSLELQKLAKGVKPGLNRNEVYAIRAQVPPLAEQQRIVAILDDAFEAIAKVKENAEKNMRNARELFESVLESVFANTGEGWEKCDLDKYVSFIDYRGKTPLKTSNGVRLITAKNVKNGYLQREPEEFINSDAYDSWMTRGIPNFGDVLFTTEAPLGNVAQLDIDEKVAFAQRIIILQPDIQKITQSFLKYLLLSRPMQNQILGKGTGATVQGIKARLLRKIQISFPKTEVQKDIVCRLCETEEKTKKLESIYKQKLANLDELNKSILQKAFAGEL